MFFADAKPNSSRCRLWLLDRDHRGKPVDLIFITAAYTLEKSIFNYRRKELGCESIAADLAQDSVNSSSRAHHKKPVENPMGYFWRSFTRKVDRYVLKSKRESAMSEDFIENALCRARGIRSVEAELEVAIYLAQLKARLDDWSVGVLKMRRMGYSFKEIGRALGMAEDTASRRFRRNVARAMESLQQKGIDAQ